METMKQQALDYFYYNPWINEVVCLRFVENLKEPNIYKDMDEIGLMERGKMEIKM
jgi:hypothetical protein